MAFSHSNPRVPYRHTTPSPTSLFALPKLLFPTPEDLVVNPFMHKPRRWPFGRTSEGSREPLLEPPLIDSLKLDDTLAKTIAAHQALAKLHDKLLADWMTWTSNLAPEQAQIGVKFAHLLSSFSKLFAGPTADLDKLQLALACIKERELKQRRIGRDRYTLTQQKKAVEARNGPQSFNTTKVAEELEENLNTFKFVQSQLARAVDGELRDTVDCFGYGWAANLQGTSHDVQTLLKQMAHAMVEEPFEYAPNYPEHTQWSEPEVAPVRLSQASDDSANPYHKPTAFRGHSPASSGATTNPSLDGLTQPPRQNWGKQSPDPIVNSAAEWSK